MPVRGRTASGPGAGGLHGGVAREPAFTSSQFRWGGREGEEDDETTPQITQSVQKATVLRLTAHQFRHAAAALMLQHDPGNYEWVRRVLGHRNIRTTINFYIGLETTQANERFGQIVREHVRFEDGEDAR